MGKEVNPINLNLNYGAEDYLAHCKEIVEKR
jgi:hypothetical protein